MNFQKSISRYTAAQIIRALGCPRATAYAWLDSTREPPEWQQPHWVKLLEQTVPSEKKKTKQA